MKKWVFCSAVLAELTHTTQTQNTAKDAAASSSVSHAFALSVVPLANAVIGNSLKRNPQGPASVRLPSPRLPIHLGSQPSHLPLCNKHVRPLHHIPLRHLLLCVPPAARLLAFGQMRPLPVLRKSVSRKHVDLNT